MSFVCSQCGETHDLPFSFAFEAPVYYYGIPEAEHSQRVVLDEELCVIDGQHFFIKGRICIPVLNSPDQFVWVVGHH